MDLLITTGLAKTHKLGLKAACQPQQVTRRGKPAVVVLSAADYNRMRQAAQDQHHSFLQHLLDFPGLEDDPRPRSGHATSIFEC